MVDYYEVVCNGLRRPLETKHINNQCVEYFYKGEEYILKDDKILGQGDGVFLYDNGDYRYEDENHCSILMRNGKVLYKTKPDQKLRSSDLNNVTNPCYRVYNSITWVLIKELDFPFNTSMLDVIDEKLKGE